MHEHYTVRVYNSKLVNKIDGTYEKCKSLYSTKNPFLVECLKRGVEEINKELFNETKSESISGIYDEIKKTIQKLDNLIRMSERTTKESLANLSVNQKLLACIYNITLGMSDDKPKSKEYIEAGIYDELPERLNKLLDKLLETVL